ncbi:MAG: carbohydrate ABC transporter substrate-binding protein [Chloroflexi bacterium]|nr:carbohydrate ABC transporter substrate-binding protein [Chloroflexota bacterium]
MYTRLPRLLTVLLLAGVLLAAGAPTQAQYTEITILATWDSAAERDDFYDLLFPFFQAENIQPNLVSETNLQQTLDQQIASGAPPDVVLMRQPGLIAGYTDRLVNLDAVLGAPASGYPPNLDALLTVNGTTYGRFVRLTAKGLVWYNGPAMSAAGYTLPGSWSELLTLTQVIDGDGGQPWALGIRDEGAVSGVGTDIIETILLQRHGPGLLDGLADGAVSWTDPRVREAWEEFGVLLDGAARGTPVDAALSLFGSSPGAYLSVGPSTVPRWVMDQQAASAADIGFFPLPAVDNPQRVIVGGDFVVLFNDDPVTLRLAQFLTTPELAAEWAALGSALSPYPGAPYPTAVQSRTADLALGQAAFDLSDRLTPDTRAAFETGVQRFVTDQSALDTILADIQATAGN